MKQNHVNKMVKIAYTLSFVMVIYAYDYECFCGSLKIALFGICGRKNSDSATSSELSIICEKSRYFFFMQFQLPTWKDNPMLVHEYC